ncbi:kinase-like domain-containing protein [Glomus cerebriforme]|uniref:Kinase-like domain-containing protein n=1 Tax=Glomus cerebriforme TaxID=658196 RepID=A0A397SFK6_9GLOM|nr:kinase-like domain-containing protein [Glomus cerebriforme]
MNETFVRLFIRCPTGCTKAATSYYWKHETDGGYVQISDRIRLKCTKCLMIRHIADCSFACDGHLGEYRHALEKSFAVALAITVKQSKCITMKRNSHNQKYAHIQNIQIISLKFSGNGFKYLFSHNGENRKRKRMERRISFVLLTPELLEFGEKIGAGAFKDCYSGKYKGASFHYLKKPVAIGKLRAPMLSESELKETMKEIEILRKLQHPNIDLKPANILISSDLRAKINDFGLGRVQYEYASIHSQVGTPIWQAPELWSLYPSYSKNVDVSTVYACGLIFWEINTWGKQVRDKGTRPPTDINTLEDYRPALI